MTRLRAVDALRGVVMVIMALDHTRDFIHAGAMTFLPEDLSRTTPAIFFTRWITHVCAPTFMFLAGLSAFLRLHRDGDRTRLARFLWTRGLWLVLIELVVMRLAMNFTFDPAYPIVLLVLTALGLSMVALAALIFLPPRVLLALSIATIVLHNAVDGLRASDFGAFAGVWNLLHQPGGFTIAGVPFVVAYPLVPWFAVMALGFCCGPVLLRPPDQRRRLLVGTGTAAIAAFLVLRAVNVYGDPAPWATQSSATLTVLSFLRATKYPPSLQFLLMTLGPPLLVLAAFDAGNRHSRRAIDRLAVIGRVPFFFYVVHFWALHLVASAMAWLRYGDASLVFLFSPLPSMGGSAKAYPADFGYPLPVAYLTWMGLVVALYPLCRRFADFKAERRGGLSSYF